MKLIKMLNKIMDLIKIKIKIMVAHRLISKNENGYLHIHLPEEIKSSEVEVILMPVSPQKTLAERKMFLDSLKGGFKTKMTIEEIDEQINQLRNEWERDF